MIFALALFTAVSCREEDNADRYLYIKDVEESYDFSRDGTVIDGKNVYDFATCYASSALCPRLDLYSNLEEWSIVPEYESDAEWVTTWPRKGSQCGKFYIMVDENKSAIAREATFNVVSAGKSMASFTVKQDGSTPYLELGMGGSTGYYAAADGGQFELKLNTNTLWNIEAEDDSWLSFGERTATSIIVNVAENTDTQVRSNRIYITEAGEKEVPLSLTFRVSQLGSNEAFSKSSKTTIAELKSKYTSGDVTENVWVEGTVINDYTRKNVAKEFISYDKSSSVYVPVADTRQMWLDDGKDGLCVEFISGVENVYPVGTKMKLHCVGKTVRIDENSGAYSLTGFSGAYVHDAEQTDGVTPVEITDMSRLKDYENRLVTLKDVQFALPLGTYLSTDERQHKQSICEYLLDETINEYAHILYNEAGQHVKLMSSSTFTQRHCRLMPCGSGDVTGIVVRRKSLTGVEYVIRLRSNDDNKVSDDPATAISKTVVRFGPFTEAKDMSIVKAEVGNGQMKTSMFSSVTAATGSNAMYLNAYSTIYKITFPETQTVFPTPADKNQYRSLNSQVWWNGTGTTLTDWLGEAWIYNISTKNFSKTAKHYLVFVNGSYGDGPKDFQLEWSTSDDTPVAEWNKIAEYETCNWRANWQARIFFYALPDGITEYENISIRHRVMANASSMTLGKGIGLTATNRTSYWAIIEME